MLRKAALRGFDFQTILEFSFKRIIHYGVVVLHLKTAKISFPFS